MPLSINSVPQSRPDDGETRKILFAPVSGPTGIGEYQRSLFLAQSLIARHPDWDVRIIVAETAPYIDSVPIPVFRTSRSPTLVPDEVAGILDEFRPDVVIFDCSGRRSSLKHAKQLGARTVFISNHIRKRRRGFRISRLRYTDDHWIIQPKFICGNLKTLECIKLRLLAKREPIFLGPVFPEATLPTHAPDRPFFICCPGGGGNKIKGRQSGAVFADAARHVAKALGILGVVVMGRNFTGELISDPQLQMHRSLPGHELAGLMPAAEFAMVGGGDLLQQAVANRVPPVSAPSAKDQPPRITAFDRQGLCIYAKPEQLGEVTVAAYSDGRLSALSERLQNSDIHNGLHTGVERIEILAAKGHTNST